MREVAGARHMGTRSPNWLLILLVSYQ